MLRCQLFSAADPVSATSVGGGRLKADASVRGRVGLRSAR